MIKILGKLKNIVFCTLGVSLVAISSCAYDSGTIMNLELLFDYGLITEESIKNIAALRNGSLQKVVDISIYPYEFETIEYEVTPVLDELSEKQSNLIINSFNDYVDSIYTKINSAYRVNKSEIIAYYGTYEGYSVVEIEYSVIGIYLSNKAILDYIVFNYYFGLISNNRTILAWTLDS